MPNMFDAASREKMALSSIAFKSVKRFPNAVAHKQPSSAPVVVGACLSAVLVGFATAIVGGTVSALLMIFLVFVSAALSNFRIGVLAAVVLLPLSATRLMPHELLGIKGLNPLNGVLAVTVLAIVLLCTLFPKRVIVPRCPRMMWMYVATILVWGIFGSIHTELIPSQYRLIGVASFDSATGYIRDIVVRPLIILTVSYALGMAVANTKRPETCLVPLFATALVLPAVVVGFVASGRVTLNMLAASNSRGFLSFLGIHANELGLMFNLSFALALFSALSAKTRAVRLVLIGVAALLAIAVVLTFSRGAFLGLLAVCVYLLVRHRRFKIIAGAILVAPFLALLIPQAVIERATTGIATGDMAAISAGRVADIWMPLLPELVAHPLFGQGLSSIMWSDAARRGTILPVGHPHNAYLGMLLDFGIVGAIFILAFFVFLFRFFRRLAADTEGSIWEGYFLGASACVVLLAVQGLTDDRVTPTSAQVFLWLSVGVAIGVKARLDRQINVNKAIPDKK